MSAVGLCSEGYSVYDMFQANASDALCDTSRAFTMVMTILNLLLSALVVVLSIFGLRKARVADRMRIKRPGESRMLYLAVEKTYKYFFFFVVGIMMLGDSVTRISFSVGAVTLAELSAMGGGYRLLCLFHAFGAAIFSWAMTAMVVGVVHITKKTAMRMEADSEAEIKHLRQLKYYLSAFTFLSALMFAAYSGLAFKGPEPEVAAIIAAVDMVTFTSLAAVVVYFMRPIATVLKEVIELSDGKNKNAIQVSGDVKHLHNQLLSTRVILVAALLITPVCLFVYLFALVLDEVKYNMAYVYEFMSLCIPFFTLLSVWFIFPKGGSNASRSSSKSAVVSTKTKRSGTVAPEERKGAAIEATSTTVRVAALVSAEDDIEPDAPV